MKFLQKSCGGDPHEYHNRDSSERIYIIHRSATSFSIMKTEDIESACIIETKRNTSKGINCILQAPCLALLTALSPLHSPTRRYSSCSNTTKGSPKVTTWGQHVGGQHNYESNIA